ncbi:MAG TPA: PAS domain S-box protein [Polyangiaceae bacterium]
MHPRLATQLEALGVSPDAPPSQEQWACVLATLGDMHAQIEGTESNFRELVEHSPDSIFVHEGGRILYANRAMATLLGYEHPDELAGLSSLSFIHPDDHARILSYREVLKETGGDRAKLQRWVEARWVSRRGDVFFMHGGATFVRWNGHLAQLTMVRDVTEQKLASEQFERASVALRGSEERSRHLFERSPMATVLFDVETHLILDVNDAACALYGYGRDEFIGLSFASLKIAAERAAFAPDVQRMCDNYRAGIDTKFRAVKVHVKKDGSLVDLDFTSYMIELGGRAVILAQCYDVTEKRALEDQLRQSQKMEAVGRLAGGIAHDFNNILAVILADADFVKYELGLEHELACHLTEIEDAASRAAALTKQLLAFSRKQVLQPRVLSVNDAVQDMERMLRRLIGEDFALELALDPAAGSSEADPNQLEQVIMNLVVNARDAMTSGGKVTIATSNTRIEPDDIGWPADMAPGPYILLSVADTGSGMDALTMSRIFEPFFTTKEMGKGTGLGLATVFGIVRQSGGLVRVTSEPGRGSTFHVYLPRIDSVATPTWRPPPDPSLSYGNERILLVEDDAHVRRAVTHVLRRRGYDVVEAPSGEDALTLFGGSEAPFDIVVTDLVMPGLDGVVVAEKLRAIAPALPVLYISGYTEHASVQRGEFGEHTTFLQKPFSPDQLAIAVRTALDREAA